MPTLPHPTPDNLTSLGDLFTYSSRATDYALGFAIVGTVWVIAFIAMANHGIAKASTAASFLSTIVSLLLLAFGGELIGVAPFFMSVGMLFLSLIALITIERV